LAKKIKNTNPMTKMKKQQTWRIYYEKNETSLFKLNGAIACKSEKVCTKQCCFGAALHHLPLFSTAPHIFHP
jgi:hypothetical protein